MMPNKYLQEKSAEQDTLQGKAAVHVGYGLGLAVRYIFTTLWKIRATVVLLAMFLMFKMPLVLVPLIWFFGSIVYFAVVRKYAQLPAVLERFVEACSPVGDVRRYKFWRQVGHSVKQAQSFLEQCGVPDADEIDCSLTDGPMGPHLEIYSIPNGMAPDALARQLAANQSRIGNPNMEARVKFVAGGGLNIDFPVVNPLEKSTEVSSFEEFGPVAANATVSLGIDENGEPIRVSFADNSGCVVGGQPGSGKTASILGWVGALAMTGQVNLSVIDGKGGYDLSPLESLCVEGGYISGDKSDDWDYIKEYLDSLVVQMNNQVRNNLQGGDPNFWNIDPDVREQNGFKQTILLIDEAQTYFDPSQATSKDEKALQTQIIRDVADLIRKGRSAGFLVIATTQKPTSDSLPSKISANCGVRIGFKMGSQAAVQSVFPELPDDCPRPTSISVKGGFLCDVDSHEPVMGRALYLPVNRMKELLGGE